MKTDKKAFTIILFFFIVFLFVLSLIWTENIQAFNPATVTCHLYSPVVSGSTVTCTLDRDPISTPCTPYDSYVTSGYCTISSGQDCYIYNIDCQCNPFRVRVSVTNGSLGTGTFSYAPCGNGAFGYPTYDGSYYWVYLYNPNTCTISFNYTPNTCNDYCDGYKLKDYNLNCTMDPGSCGGGATRYTGGECNVCPFNNSSCSKYTEDVNVTSECRVFESMYINAGKTIHVGTNGKIILTSSSTLTLKSGGKILMEGGSIEIDGGQIIVQ